MLAVHVSTFCLVGLVKTTTTTTTRTSVAAVRRVSHSGLQMSLLGSTKPMICLQPPGEVAPSVSTTKSSE